MNNAKPFVLKVITPLHVGSGQDLGIIDLPIQRERHTGYPKIEASSLKGCLRENFRNNQLANKHLDLIFGPEESGDHAGALGFIDARLLLFPIKSVKGLFAWATSFDILSKWLKLLQMIDPDLNFEIENPQNGECIVTDKSKLVVNNNAVVLEEYCFQKSENPINVVLLKKLITFTGIELLAEQLIILSKDDLKDMVNLSTEVITRTKIDPRTGTVATGALFTEEYLPSESVLYSMAIPTSIYTASEVKKDFLSGRKDKEAIIAYWDEHHPTNLQIGGNATIGKGIVELFYPKIGVEHENN
jgi:CRISPR-associated protein Cmr4